MPKMTRRAHLLVNHNAESLWCHFKAYSSLLSSCFHLQCWSSSRQALRGKRKPGRTSLLLRSNPGCQDKNWKKREYRRTSLLLRSNPGCQGKNWKKREHRANALKEVREALDITISFYEREAEDRARKTGRTSLKKYAKLLISRSRSTRGTRRTGRTQRRRPRERHHSPKALPSIYQGAILASSYKW